MDKNGNKCIWQPGEIIYSYGDEPNGAFLVMSGHVDLYTSEGLKLNRIGESEIFGETSIILHRPRTVTARAGEYEVSAIHFTSDHIRSLIRRSKALGAIIKKTQMRLIDSNKQSQGLSEDLEALIKIIESGKETNSQMISMVKKMRQNLKRLSFED